jgi:hypothetical protein
MRIPAILIAGAVCATVGPSAALATSDGRFCSATAARQLTACGAEVQDDFFTAKAICINLSDDHERAECFEEAEADQADSRQLCRTQHHARRDLCHVLGEGRYDPDFDPVDFDDDFTNLANPNPYFPLTIGNRWKYVGGGETITVRVLDKIKLIEDVTCIVVNDLVTEDGQKIEDTDDWYAQATNGDAYYCGEIAKNFETFEGDDPEKAELVDVEGSWKAGRDGSKPGIIFLNEPRVGDLYRQEWAPGDAEDVAKVLSTTYHYGDGPELDEFVPQELADLLCASSDCIVTLDFTPVEPGVFERKYYAPEIGLFLEVDPKTGDIVQLVRCSFDARCEDLPEPVDDGDAD